MEVERVEHPVVPRLLRLLDAQAGETLGVVEAVEGETNGTSIRTMSSAETGL
jgi:hypothetical protein